MLFRQASLIFFDGDEHVGGRWWEFFEVPIFAIVRAYASSRGYSTSRQPIIIALKIINISSPVRYFSLYRPTLKRKQRNEEMATTEAIGFCSFVLFQGARRAFLTARKAAASTNASDDSEQQEHPSFHLFPLLPRDVKLHILAHVAEASTGEPLTSTSPLTHVLPLVSHEMRDLCQSNHLWRNALEILVRKESFLWRKGLLMLCETNDTVHLDHDDFVPSELVARVHARMNHPGYLSLSKMVKRLFTQFTANVFAMPLPDGNLPCHEPDKPIFCRLTLPRDGFLIQFLTEQSSFVRPRHLVLMDSSKGGPDAPAALFKLRDCIVHSPVLVCVWFDPVQHVKIQSIREETTQFRLPTFTATCLCLRNDLDVTSRTTHVEQAGVPGNDDVAPCSIL